MTCHRSRTMTEFLKCLIMTCTSMLYHRSRTNHKPKKRITWICISFLCSRFRTDIPYFAFGPMICISMLFHGPRTDTLYYDKNCYCHANPNYFLSSIICINFCPIIIITCINISNTVVGNSYFTSIIRCF